MKEINDIIVAHLHDEATSEEVKHLFEWIQTDPENANEFARATMLYTQLREQFSGQRQARESGEFSNTLVRDEHEANSPQRSQRMATAKTLVVALAMCLVVSIVYVLGRRGDNQNVVNAPTPPKNFVTVSQTIDAVWSGSENYQSGDRTAAAAFNLESGFVRLRIDSGVEVTLEGPAEFELVSAVFAKFQSGLLTSTVPVGAEGFRIDTPMAQVVDLGTAFGIDLSKDGAETVSVFDGEVEVGLNSSDAKQLLTEGEAVRVDANRDMQSVAFDASAYEKIWPVSSGIASSSGAFRFAPPWPRRLRHVRSDSDIFVLPERYAVTLDESLSVNISTPGKYTRESELTPEMIASGQSVRSFVLHYHPEQVRRPRRAKRISGSIVFDRPVLGLVILHQELNASAGRFAPRNAGEAHQRRQIELNGGPAGDEVTLSPDGHTVTLDLASPNYTSDLVRVIVDASIPSASPSEAEN